ncbi:MAG: polygalacturonase [Proteobacteria bacterium]|nr:polygalacturonase [Pseudomonadota bacterium]
MNPMYAKKLLCRTLEASLQQTGGVLPAGVDADPARSQPDSARIQAAIDACPAGQAVKLVSAGSNNAFLAGLVSPAGTRVTQTTAPGSATPLSCPDSLFAKFPSGISPI